MACGVPVVVSNTTSLPEVVGESGLAVEPTDIDAITAALRKLLNEPAFATTLKEAGVERARTFSWERCARETLEVYAAVSRKA
jgi:glycosyltransferase involved in cell wall biosynthesis